MKFNINSLLKNKSVLYIVLFIAVMNLFGYLMLRNIDAVFFFMSLGLITSYFSKNMIVVMLVAMVGTNLLMSFRRPTKEGFDDDDDDNDKNKNKKNKPKAASEELDEEEATGKKPQLDYASTIEKAYDNMDKLLGSDALKHMGDRTQNLVNQQSKLMETMNNMKPMMDTASNMLNKLDIGNIDQMMEKVIGMTKNFEKKEKDKVTE